MPRPSRLLAFGTRKSLRKSTPARSRFLPRLEHLEQRRLLANLRITGANLVDGNLNPITQPIIGQMLRVRMDFSTESLPVGSSYTLAFSVQGVQLKYDNIGWGSGVSSGFWYSTQRGWYIESGVSHTVEVRVDLDNTVPETNEADNRFSFSFTPVRATPPVKLSWPESGTLGVDRLLTNYLDLDPTSGTRDFTGGQTTYDSHEGIDTGGANNSFMDLGIPIIAAAPGTVIEAADGNFDRNRGSIGDIVPGGDPNYVAIDHGGGLITYYLHMRRDSVRVNVGDTVVRGQALGLEGSSGYSTGSHIHFAVYYYGLPVETYLDPDTFWQSAPPWIMTSRAIVVGGITNYDLVNHLGEDVSDVERYLPIAGQRVYAWGMFSGVRQGDAIRAIYRRPDGSIYSNLVLTSGQDWSVSYWYFFTVLPTLTTLGTWTVDMLAGGQLLKTYAFEVSNVAQPEIRVEETDPKMIVLDERSTPYDFGAVTAGAAAPTQTFRVVNHGSGTLNIQNLQVPAGFTIVEGLPSTLAPGQADLFTIGMSTSIAGYKAGQVRILTNDLDEAETNFAVEGSVVAAPPRLKLGIGLRHAAEGTQVIANVSRTGSTASSITVALTSNDLTEATVPNSITIPAGAERATFLINTIQDGILDDKQIVQLVAAATGYSPAANTLDVEDNRALVLSLVAAPISENGGAATITLTRSFTDLWQPLTVALSAAVSGMLTLPTKVTFAADQQSLSFNVTAIDNNILEGGRLVNVVATAATHGSASTTVEILDEEQLGLEIDRSTISENGGQATVTVRRLNSNIDTPLTVRLINSNPALVSLIGSVELPAGISSTSVSLSAIDDNLLNGLQTVAIEAQATGYVSTSRSLLVTDYESLTVSLNVPAISEQGGRAVGSVHRNNTNIGQPILVNLTSNDTTEAVVPATVIIPAFAASANFDVDAIDDFLLEATQDVQITASSAGYIAGVTTLQVEDAESLTLSLNTLTFSERAGSTIATVSRSNTNTNLPLTVALTSADTSEVTMPQEVIIAAGQSFVSFNVTSADDDLLDGPQLVSISVSASGYRGATSELTVTDHEELSLTLASSSISERQGTTIGRITRSNSDINSDLQVDLTNSDSTAVSIPASIIIPAGQRFNEFEIVALDDDFLDGSQSVNLNAMATGYVTSGTSLIVTDYETATLTLESATVSEKNATTRGTVTRNNIDIESTVIFTLTTNDSTEATIQNSVMIPPGQSSATFTIQSVDDGLLDGDQLVTITASSNAYPATTVLLTVSDWEELFLSVTPANIVENGGQANVRVSRANVDNALPLEVTISNSDPSELTSISSITIPAGSVFVEFPVTGADDFLLDGLQTTELLVSAPGYVSSSQTVTIADFESIDISLEVSSIDERSGRVIATISRSNTDTEQSVSVSLSSSLGSRINLPASVAILAGQSSITFAIDAINDVLLNGSTLVDIVASAAGYRGDTVQLSVLDDEALTPWRNPRNSLDVDDSGQVVPLDALLLINSLNTEGARELAITLPDPFDPARYYDCNGDRFLSSIDALLVINFLNTGASQEGEESFRSSAATDLALLSLEGGLNDSKTSLFRRSVTSSAARRQRLIEG